jgi:MFS family permease
MVLILILLLLASRLPAPPAESAPVVSVPAGRGFRKTGWLANFTVQLATGGATAIFPQLATSLDIHADAHGGLLALGRVAALMMIIGLHVVTFWHSRLWPLWLAQLVCAGAVALLAGTSLPAFFLVAFLLMGAVNGYSYQASIFFTLDEMSERGKGTGLHEAFLAGGMLLGPLLAGWAGNHFGLRAPYLVCAIALLVGVALQLLVVIRQRRAYGARQP